MRPRPFVLPSLALGALAAPFPAFAHPAFAGGLPSGWGGVSVLMAAEGPSGAAPARPGDIAVREELDTARRVGTVEAYELFLARHGNHPLARTAAEERERVLAASKTR